MKKPSNPKKNKVSLREKIIGLGERSIRKSYYPQLQKQLENLEESERRFRELAELLPQVLFETDEKGYLLYANRCAFDDFGYTQDDFDKGLNAKQMFIPGDRERFGKNILRILNGEHIGGIEYIALRKDGATFPVVVFASPIIREDKTIGLSGILIDVTERKLMETSLKESENKFKTLSEYSLVGVYLIQDGVFRYTNNCLAKIFGYTAEEIVDKKGPQDLIFPEDRAIVLDNITKRIAGEMESIHYEFRGLKKNGKIINVEVYGSRTIYRGKPAVIGNLLDVTERKKTEEALRASEAELYDHYFIQAAINMILSESLKDTPLEMILQKALNIILSIPWFPFESNGSIFLVQDEPAVLVMRAQSNLIGSCQEKSSDRVPFGKCLCGRAALTQEIQFAERLDVCHEICHEGMPDHGHYVVPILSGGRTLGVINLCLKEGHIRNQKEEEFLLAVADTLAGIIMRKQIEDEKEELHTQFLQAQKMEAVGQLAGGVAHDFNNILTAMIGYGHLLKMKLKEEDPLAGYADHILSLSDKAANLTKSLLAFSRKQIINPRPVDLNEIIRRIDHLLSRIIGEDIQLKTMLSEGVLTVMADPGQMEQVLMNLATNARDAMPGGGLLTIQTETVAVDHEFIKSHGFGKEGPYVLLSLTDTGIGMDRETTENIFEPFFTTKELGKGTGLGLAMVYGIVKQHEGNIDVYSEPGKGTTFRIYLPLIEAEAEEIKPEVIQPVEKGTETVLLAEDETEVREFTKHLLEENDYRVITAADGEDAINKFKVYKNEIQFVLLDVIMPNKNGKEVYDEIKQIRPGIKVLFLSGYPADIIHKHGIIEKGFAYIEKPVSPTKLLKKIREVLSE